MANAPLYDVLVVCHVLSAVIGFGALVVSGGFGAAMRRQRAAPLSSALARYYAPGHNFAVDVLYLVPVFGVALILDSPEDLAGRAFVWIGVALWLVALSVAHAVVLPAERRLQVLVQDSPTARAARDGAARRVALGASVTTACFVAALIVMVAQP